MTFSGLPSLRDPKHSHKNSASSASSSSSSSPTSSPTTKPISNHQQQHQQQQQQQQQQQDGAVLDTTDPTANIAPPTTMTTSTTSEARSGSGATILMVSANVPAETVPTTLMESSIQGLIQTSFGHVVNTHSQGIAQSSSIDLYHRYHHHQMQQIQSPPVHLPMASPVPVPVAKKKAIPQNLSPAHSAAYRKRLNVNQVCDWCRYRKIRCDRESPCNSCQHSKRECIRTPPSALLANQQTNQANEQDLSSVSSPTSFIGKTKRARATNKDGRSRRASKSYRGSSISSHHSSSYTSYSSDNGGYDDDDDDDEENGDDEAKSENGFRAEKSSVSPVVGSLILAGLGLSGLGLDIGDLGSSLDLEATRRSDFQIARASSFDSSMALLQETCTSHQMNLRDQEHLERMQRIEVLLSNVIPGAAEFIASGSYSFFSLQQQQQQRRPSVVEKKGLPLSTHNLDQREQQFQPDQMLSPQVRLARISLSSPAINAITTWAWPSSPSGLTSLREENESIESQSSSSSSMPLISGPGYIERMKRIELLLGTVQDVPLSKALISQSQGHVLSSGSSRSNSVDISDANRVIKKLSRKDQKRTGKADGKKSNFNSDGTVVKRPHVAAGFAGQKPPPKLPQAIAEAAQKKQAIRKKRVSAAATRASAAASATASTASTDPTIATTVSETKSNNASAHLSSAPMPHGRSDLSTVQGSDEVTMDSRMSTLSKIASLEIPSTFDNDVSTSCSHQQQHQHQQQQRVLNMQQLRQHQMQMAQHRNSISFQPQSQVFNPYQQQQQQLSMSSVNSMGSYGSLVVPASSSTGSSPSASPNLLKATVIDQDNINIVTHHQQQHHHLSFAQTQLSGDSKMGFDAHQGMFFETALQVVEDALIHPSAFTDQQQQQQQRHHQSIQNNQDEISDFGLRMDESLEGLMKSTKSFDRFMEGFSTDPSSVLDHQLSPSTPSGAPTGQFSYFQSLQQIPTQQQQHFQQQQLQQPGHLNFQEMSRTMWMPTHSAPASFTVPSNPEFTWFPQQQQQSQPQQQTMQSINISANDSLQEELELDLGSESHQGAYQQQQQQQQRQMEKQLQHQQLQQQRASIQHQHQQTLYIPQMQDEDDESDGLPDHV
ncbi:hypothetical protein BGX33_011351 [Mortierella sp. NVP41]|nr:hypothetical protein BGX33_011351 [Mortierella sp. NVP41]